VNEDLVLKIDEPNSELLGKKGLSEKHIRYYDTGAKKNPAVHSKHLRVGPFLFFASQIKMAS
jgi:hypothetical protein